jgi:protein-S-isoprenylcysteine O-methyltransferase Ste14
MTHHDGRPDLIGEHPKGDLGQLIFLAVFLLIWIIDSFFLRYSIFIAELMPFYLRIILLLIVLIPSGYLAVVSHEIIFGEKRKKPLVIKNGVFRFVRHPLYLAALLFYLCLLVYSFSIIAAVFWIIIIAFYNYIAKYEEKMLLEKFGKEYQEYMNEVPRWVPGFKRNKQQVP